LRHFVAVLRRPYWPEAPPLLLPPDWLPELPPDCVALPPD